MKNVYVCEKCGTCYSDYASALKCEESHSLVDCVYKVDFSKSTSDKFPKQISVKFYQSKDNKYNYFTGEYVLKNITNDSDFFNKKEEIREKIDEYEKEIRKQIEEDYEKNNKSTENIRWYYFDKVIEEYKKEINPDFEVSKDYKMLREQETNLYNDMQKEGII